MKIGFLLIGLMISTSASAQMFYDARSSFDSTGSTSSGGGTIKSSFDDEPTTNQPELPFEKLVSKEIQERIRPDASYIVGQPDEVMCFGIARKSPKKRSATVGGYAHIGNCGSLNDVGLAEVQKQLLNSASYQMNVSKISSCVVMPRLALRFRKNYDFVDLILSGGNCPGVIFQYGGDTREFYAKPIEEWLNNFISAVSNDLEPIGTGKAKDQESLFKARTIEAEPEPVKSEPAAPKQWGRRFDAAPATETNQAD